MTVLLQSHLESFDAEVAAAASKVMVTMATQTGGLRLAQLGCWSWFAVRLELEFGSKQVQNMFLRYAMI